MTTRLHTPPPSLVDELDRAGVQYTLVPHPRTESARSEALALHVAPSDVAKTIVLVTPEGFVRAVLPASARLDLHKVRDVLGPKTRLATEQEQAGAYPEFELGAVPPLPLGDGDRVIADNRLSDCDHVLLDAGTHEQSLRLRPRDLLELTHATIVDICED